MKENKKIFLLRSIIIIAMIILIILCYFGIQKDTERIKKSEVMQQNQEQMAE